MKIINEHGLPQPIVNAVERDDYSKGDAWISVTGLINSPRVYQLRRLHHHEMIKDVSEMIWPLAGKALHKILELGGDEEHISEERLYMEINGWRISGAIDVQRVGFSEILISDYKFTSAYAVINGKDDWEKQLNCYAELVESSTPNTVIGIQVVAFVRDWNRHRVDGDPRYPKTPVVVVPLKLWSHKDRRAYMEDQLERHIGARMDADLGGEIEHCTDDERWKRAGGFVVRRKGTEKAYRVATTLEDAEKIVSERKKPDEYEIVERPSQYIRCAGNYCGVAEWCSQWRSDRPDDPSGDEADGSPWEI